MTMNPNTTAFTLTKSLRSQSNSFAFFLHIHLNESSGCLIAKVFVFVCVVEKKTHQFRTISMSNERKMEFANTIPDGDTIASFIQSLLSIWRLWCIFCERKNWFSDNKFGLHVQSLNQFESLQSLMKLFRCFVCRLRIFVA